MRARGFLVALVFGVVALVASACSGSTSSESAQPTIPSTATETEGGDGSAQDGSTGRILGEPSSDGAADLGDADATDSFDTPEGLAFEDRAAAEDRADGEESSADPDAETDDVETTGTDSASEPDGPRSDFDRLVDELIVFVENERGYEFTTRPSIELLDTAEFAQAWTQLIDDDVAENSADYVNYTDIYRAMGVIEGDRNLEEIWQRFGNAGVIGFYEHETGGITLRSGEVTAFTETVLVHELVHALEDQIFDLDRPEYNDASSELEWTFSALTEGSARRIESNYRATFSQPKLDEEAAARQALPRSVSLAEFNTSFLELQFGRYRYGEDFASALWAQGQDTLDAAFAAPPATSELVIDPSAFLANSASGDAVTAPPADGDVFLSGVWGEAGWAAVFADLTDRDAALAIAEGWAGDSFVAWRNGGTACVRSHLVGESPTELDEYAAALEEWALTDEGREIFYPSADLIRITACG